MNDKTRVFNQDCLIGMKQFPDKYFELAIVDPPYGLEMSKQIGSCRVNTFRKQENKQWDDTIPTEEYFTELFRVSKNQIIWGANYFTKYLPASMGWIFWFKNIGGNFSDGELAFTSFQRALKKVDLTIETNRISNNRQLASAHQRIHPTQKPRKLYKWLLKNYAKEGDKILDSHGGSMSSVIACLEMGFQITCYEQDPDYYQAAKKRIEQYLAQQKLFDTHKEVEFIY